MSYDAVILCDATCPMIGNDPAQYACTRAMGHVGRHLAVDRDDDIIIWKTAGSWRVNSVWADSRLDDSAFVIRWAYVYSGYAHDGCS